jgi:hypothetical protein
LFFRSGLFRSLLRFFYGGLLSYFIFRGYFADFLGAGAFTAVALGKARFFTKHRSPIIAPAWVIPGRHQRDNVFGTHNAFYA